MKAEDHSLEDALSKLNDRIVKVLKAVKRIDEATAALPACFACHIERVTAERSGAAAEDLPPLRPIAAILPVQGIATAEGVVISGGGGVCTTHLQIGDAPAPAMPGRTASGLIVAAPGMGV